MLVRCTKDGHWYSNTSYLSPPATVTLGPPTGPSMSTAATAARPVNNFHKYNDHRTTGLEDYDQTNWSYEDDQFLTGC